VPAPPSRGPHPSRPSRTPRDAWVEAHAAASARLSTVDGELESLLADRMTCLEQLAVLRARLNRRWTDHHVRRHARVDEPPVPPAPPGATSVDGVDLRAVCVALLRRHGPQTLRTLHGLLHQYGYVVGGVRPVQRLGDAMAYEVRCGRLIRVGRGTYAADDGAPPARRRSWEGPPPGLGSPLPWSRPVTDPGPPHVDPPVANDPEHWSGGAWPAPPCDGGPPPPPGPPGGRGDPGGGSLPG